MKLTGKNKSAFKTYLEVANPSKKAFTVQLVTAVLAYIFYILEPIAAAYVITNLTENNAHGAYLWLFIAFMFILVRQLVWHINFWNYSKLYSSVYNPVQKKIYSKIINAKDINFKESSKEKLMNIINNNVLNISEFADLITMRMAQLIRVLITLILVFTNNIMVGLAIIGITILNYYILTYINNKIGKNKKEQYDARDKILEKFSEISGGRNYIKDFNLDKTLQNEYNAEGEKFVKKIHEGTILLSVRNNWFFAYWNLLIMFVSMYLVFLVVDGDSNFTLTMYLIVVPYFATSMSEINEFFKLFTDFKTAYVSTLRIKTILDFSEKELIEYGNNLTDKINGKIIFNDVTVTCKEGTDVSFASLYNASFKIDHGELITFKGNGSCGKRAIFHLLRRTIKPDSGTILVDDINIYDFSRSVYSHNISYTTHNAFFFEGSIMKNMLAVNNELKKEDVFEMCKKLNIHEYIESLPNKYDTNLNKEEDLILEEKWFLMSLACVLLSKSEIVMIYEFPISLSSAEIETIKQNLLKFKKERTIIIFTASEKYLDISDKIYEVENNKIIPVKKK